MTRMNLIKMTDIYQYRYKEGKFDDWFTYSIVDGFVFIHPIDALGYIRYKIGIMGGVFSYVECLECLNDITKEISAFGPHQKK